MTLPFAAISTGLCLFSYFWLLIFLDGLVARLLGTQNNYFEYLQEDRCAPAPESSASYNMESLQHSKRAGTAELLSAEDAKH
ncbi:hypothetical protein DICVIV_12077 [Dictyocaulus viviparus]|uniref:Uncharacterized protein n=1 Tax=Dictyocaulus viviparus TaxID=29172 RepID=A0A0D8XDV4_DICVI|nr:hypothetical protein DICVIV_12077 [Dictyocaulus viviparus]